MLSMISHLLLSIEDVTRVLFSWERPVFDRVVGTVRFFCLIGHSEYIYEILLGISDSTLIANK